MHHPLCLALLAGVQALGHPFAGGVCLAPGNGQGGGGVGAQ
jgi:hypothetical protein